jgi:hypothetical protein
MRGKGTMRHRRGYAGGEIEPTPNRNQSVPNHPWMCATIVTWVRFAASERLYKHREKPVGATSGDPRECRVP